MPFDTADDHTIDPSVIVHDGQAYLFWGKERCFWARLDESLTALAGPISEIDLPDFKEGAHVHERDGWFYLSYGYQYPQRVAYAMSRVPEGPWEFRGILNEVPRELRDKPARNRRVQRGLVLLLPQRRPAGRRQPSALRVRRSTQLRP